MGFSCKTVDTGRHLSRSGGEKAQPLLGLATFAVPDMIVLDEPTNHLDIDSRAALAEATNDFPGAVIMVSHDRYLIDACAERLWLVADQKVVNFDCDLDDYRRMVLSARGRDPDTRTPDKPAPAKPARDKTDNRSGLKKRIAQWDAEIARITDIIAKIDAALALPDIFTRDPRKAAQLAKARANATDALVEAEEEAWLEASAEYEAAG